MLSLITNLVQCRLPWSQEDAPESKERAEASQNLLVVRHAQLLQSENPNQIKAQAQKIIATCKMN